MIEMEMSKGVMIAIVIVIIVIAIAAFLVSRGGTSSVSGGAVTTASRAWG